MHLSPYLHANHFKSHFFFSPLSLSAILTHTNTQKSLNSLKNIPFLSTQKYRVLGSIQEEISTNSSSKVRLCIDLWFKFFCYQNPSLIYTKIVILHPRIISKLKIFIKGSQGQKHFIFLPFFLAKPNQHPKVSFIPPIFCFNEFCGGGGEYKWKCRSICVLYALYDFYAYMCVFVCLWCWI